VVGGPAALTLPDGTSLRRGAVGAGAAAVLGKTGGEPIQAELDLEYAAPTLELNAAGFQPDSNLAAISPGVRFVRADGLGPLRSLSVGLSGRAEWSADDRRLLREASVGADLAVLLPGFNDLRCSAAVQGWAWDLREVVGTGIAYERPAEATFGCDLTTNRHRPLALQLGATATRFETAGLLDGAGTWGGSGQVAAFVRPARRFELRAGVKLDQEIVPGRFIDEADDGTLRLGDLLSRSVTLKLRQELLLSQDLSVQLYAELFSAFGRYRALYRAARPGDGRLYVRALEPLPTPDEALDFRLSSLRVNAVLRWEYRRGSTLFLVYTRQQDGERQVDPRERTELGFRTLGVAPAVDVFLVKLSIWTVH
jgi:hypothetical protein